LSGDGQAFGREYNVCIHSFPISKKSGFINNLGG